MNENQCWLGVKYFVFFIFNKWMETLISWRKRSYCSMPCLLLKSVQSFFNQSLYLCFYQYVINHCNMKKVNKAWHVQSYMDTSSMKYSSLNLKYKTSKFSKKNVFKLYMLDLLNNFSWTFQHSKWSNTPLYLY